MIRQTRLQRLAYRLKSFGRVTLKPSSWRLFLRAQTIALAVAFARFFEHRNVDVTQIGFVMDRLVIAHPHFPDAHFIVAPLAATLLVVSALGAKEGMRRGAGLNTCVLLGVGAASIVTAVLQWCIRSLLGGEFAPDADRPLLSMAVVAVDVGMLGTLFTVAYLKHESEREILLNIRQTESRRVELDRHRLAFGLETSRAIVDPQWLSARLGEIRDLYENGASTAEIRLDELIDELRRRVSASSMPNLARRGAA